MLRCVVLHYVYCNARVREREDRDSGGDVELKQTSHRVHMIEDAKGQADIHHSNPQVHLVEIKPIGVLKLWPGTKGWHDPQL